ncbi:hypothetical protein [Streptomyces sp. CC208A]|nr:hypothetical protein [Streptomyces sp. CC208A]
MKFKRILVKVVAAFSVASAVIVGAAAAPAPAGHSVVAGGTSVPADPGWG